MSILGTEKEDHAPKIFLCPISLEPMCDPVTLNTGQTYERANIQRWFDEGHSTCPATMQELNNFTLTPNHTLRHLIQDWHSRNGLPLPNQINKQHHILIALSTIRSSKGQSKLMPLKDLQFVMEKEIEAREIFLEEGGVTILGSLLGINVPRNICEVVISILILLQMKEYEKKFLVDPEKLACIVHVIQKSSNAISRTNAARLIELLVESKDVSARIGSNLDVLTNLLRLMKESRESGAVRASLSSLKVICCSNKQARLMLVEAGAISTLTELLPKASTECAELGLNILDCLCSTREGRRAMASNSSGIASLVGMIKKVCEKSAQHVVSILWVICKSEGAAAMEAIRAGAAAKLLLILQSSCSPTLKHRSVELLKLLNHSYNTSTMIENTHVIVASNIH